MVISKYDSMISLSITPQHKMPSVLRDTFCYIVIGLTVLLIISNFIVITALSLKDIYLKLKSLYAKYCLKKNIKQEPKVLKNNILAEEAKADNNN